jgi:hypothetical protein
MAEDIKQCRPMKGWTIVVPRNFTEIDNGDSWQAYAGVRCVYVSFIWVADTNGAVSATALFATASSKLAPASEADRHSFEEPGLNGGAQITQTDTGFELKGFTCVDGCVATCVISFAKQTDRDWAVATWRSLGLSASKPKPWWRLW